MRFAQAMGLFVHLFRQSQGFADTTESKAIQAYLQKIGDNELCSDNALSSLGIHSTPAPPGFELTCPSFTLEVNSGGRGLLMTTKTTCSLCWLRNRTHRSQAMRPARGRRDEERPSHIRSVRQTLHRRFRESWTARRAHGVYREYIALAVASPATRLMQQSICWRCSNSSPATCKLALPQPEGFPEHV